MENNENIFSTRDLPLAATLVTLKFEMIGIDYQFEGTKNSPIGYFKFNNTDSVQDAKRRYNQGLLMIEPKSFVTNLHGLKAEVVNAINNLE